MSQKTIAVIGAGGFVGSALCEVFEKKQGIALTRVTRTNYEAMQSGSYDVLINAAMPSGRFWAEKNPELDFQETVKKTSDLLMQWHFKKFIQIGSISARTQLDTVYGRNKAEAEKLCGPNALVVRLTSMYGEGLTKGALIDILNRRKVFVSGESRYAFTPLEFVGTWLAKNLHRAGIIEVGAKNSVSLTEIADSINGKIEFQGILDVQEIQNPEPDFPDARGVIDYMKRKKKELSESHEQP